MLSISKKEFPKMAKAKQGIKKKNTSRYYPSNLSVFVIVLLLVALGTVTWLFITLANSTNL